MTYKIALTDLAKQIIKEISDRRIQRKIAERIDRLAHDPEHQGKPLRGILSGYRSVRAVGQRYRIVFRIKDQQVVVQVIGIGIRKEGSKADIYERLKKLFGRS